MTDELQKRQKELKRESNVSAIEAGSLLMKVGETKCFKIMDLQSWQRIRSRLTRLKKKTKMEFKTTIEGNKLTVKRIS